MALLTGMCLPVGKLCPGFGRSQVTPSVTLASLLISGDSWEPRTRKPDLSSRSDQIHKISNYGAIKQAVILCMIFS